jgi:hypothetical protein
MAEKTSGLFSRNLIWKIPYLNAYMSEQAVYEMAPIKPLKGGDSIKSAHQRMTSQI